MTFVKSGAGVRQEWRQIRGVRDCLRVYYRIKSTGHVVAEYLHLFTRTRWYLGGWQLPIRLRGRDRLAEETATNRIVRENRLVGARKAEWDVRGAGDVSIQGYATEISVNVDGTIWFKVDTDAVAYTIDVYRLGYYRGRGARKIATIAPSASLPQHQPAPLFDESTGLVDCGNWAVSASWTIPAAAPSGVYIAKLTRLDTGGASHIPFVVRDDASTSDILFQTSDTTWQAYNRYGGLNLYSGNPDDPWDTPSRARKVSYNRPFTTGGDARGRDYLFSTEYPTIRFLERNGYDVTYVSGVDTDRRDKQMILNHKLFLSVGHDEYWSQTQRSNVEDARDAGVHLMFLSGNQVYWRTRYECSTDGSETPYRTLVCYKETADNARTDPSSQTTATWRDPRFPSSPQQSGPENRLCGTISMAIDTDLPITVTAAQGRLRLWRGTNLATMKRARAPLASHTIGYESNEDLDNGCRPPGLIHFSTTVGAVPQRMIDFGTEVEAGVTTHHVTLYRSSSNSLVFDAGTVQWAWGLDRHHTGQRGVADSRMQQAVVNMLADMEIFPVTLMRRLVAARPSDDHQPPVSIITSPRPGETIEDGSRLTVSGAAIDEDGQVAGVEVSIDGGLSWHVATGTTSWTYSEVIEGSGPVSIWSRAIDDSANMEVPRTSVEVLVVDGQAVTELNERERA
jgi:Bacterial Ig domain